MKNFDEQIEKLQKEKEATEKFFHDLPKNLQNPDSFCWHNSKLCEFSIGYEFKNIEEVYPWYKKFKKYILPLELRSGWYTSFLTKKHPIEENVKNITAVFPITVGVSTHELVFEFYAYINGHLISVDLKSAFRSGFERYARVSYNTELHYGEKYVKDVRLHTPAFSNHQEIKWAKGGNEYPNHYTMYWDNPSMKFEEMFSL